MAIRPVDIARQLGISTTTLRKYEESGLMPAVARSSSGYRRYTGAHVAYVTCARHMMPAFSIREIAKIFKQVMQGNIDAALWMANKAQADLQNEKMIAEKTVQKLLHDRGKSSGPRFMPIHEVSRETGVPATTIRYWDKAGLIAVPRYEGNRYRLFTDEHIRQILALYAIKISLSKDDQWHSTESLRIALKELEGDKHKLEAMMKGIEVYLNQFNRAQIKAVSALYRLCAQVENNSFDEEKKTGSHSV